MTPADCPVCEAALFLLTAHTAPDDIARRLGYKPLSLVRHLERHGQRAACGAFETEHRAAGV